METETGRQTYIQTNGDRNRQAGREESRGGERRADALQYLRDVRVGSGQAREPKSGTG